MLSFIVYVKEGFPFAQNLSLESSMDSYLFLTGFSKLSVLLLIPLSTPSLALCKTFHSISSNIDKVLSINPSANVFVDLVNSVIISLLRWLTFLLPSLTVTLALLLSWIYFYLLMLVFILQWFSLYWEIQIMLHS